MAFGGVFAAQAADTAHCGFDEPVLLVSLVVLVSMTVPCGEWWV